MSLDFSLTVVQPTEVFSANITHNLGAMAKEAGIYFHLWRPEEIGITKGSELITPLTVAITEMEHDPTRFKKHNSPNGWGTYKHFVPFVQSVLQGCMDHPDATISVCR